MDKILIMGIDTVAGANFAATWADRFQLCGLSTNVDLQIAGCQSTRYHGLGDVSPHECLSERQPDWLVHCGSASRSSWESPGLGLCGNDETETVRHWAQAAAECDVPFVFISSDSIFTGPWMFHDENSLSFCRSRQARWIRDLEACVLACNPTSLIVRTNTYGWAPQLIRPDWIDRTLRLLELQRPVDCESVRHATPILATDLAEVLASAMVKQLQGIYHIAGAERVNPAVFVQRLAEQFDLPEPQPVPAARLSERPQGFGRGETSLKTTKIRRKLGTAMPVLDEGLARLYAQLQNGHCERLNGAPVHEKVA